MNDPRRVFDYERKIAGDLVNIRSPAIKLFNRLYWMQLPVVY
jgi:hypothetical protein